LEGQEAYSWFPDRLDGRTEHEIPIDADEMALLRAARKKVGGDLKYIDVSLPSLDALPGIPQLGDLHRSLLELDTVSSTIDEQRLPRFRTISAAHLEAAGRVRDLLREAARLRRSLSDNWIDWLRQQHEAQQAAQPVFAVVTQMAEEMGALVEMRRKFLGVAIEWEEE
jgi:hypothetical protein